MPPNEDTNVISMARAKALRDTLRALHSERMRGVIYDGASNEFKIRVTPVLIELLEAKGAPKDFSTSIVSLLEMVYAAYHLDTNRTRALAAALEQHLLRDVDP